MKQPWREEKKKKPPFFIEMKGIWLGDFLQLRREANLRLDKVGFGLFWARWAAV